MRSCLILALLSAAATARAESPAVSVEVSRGLAGIAPRDGIDLITVRLRNRTAAVQRGEVSVADSRPRAFSLPGGGVAVVHLWRPLPKTANLAPVAVSVGFDGLRPVVAQAPAARVVAKPVALIGADPQSLVLRAANNPSLRDDIAGEPILLASGALPEVWPAYRGVTLIIDGDADLEDAARRAVRRHVKSGGRVCVLDGESPRCDGGRDSPHRQATPRTLHGDRSAATALRSLALAGGLLALGLLLLMVAWSRLSGGALIALGLAALAAGVSFAWVAPVDIRARGRIVDYGSPGEDGVAIERDALILASVVVRAPLGGETPTIGLRDAWLRPEPGATGAREQRRFRPLFADRWPGPGVWRVEAFSPHGGAVPSWAASLQPLARPEAEVP